MTQNLITDYFSTGKINELIIYTDGACSNNGKKMPVLV